MHRFPLIALAWMLAMFLGLAPASARQAPAAAQPPRPNILLILADDLGYGDLGSYGQKRILTPHLDRLASAGARFTSFYAGSTVCAPSRCVLMTGKHTGRATVRGNDQNSLGDADLTLGALLQSAGYETAIVGKWALGEEGSRGTPGLRGFDEFYGYLNQTHAHNYWPDYLWRNRARVDLPNVVGQRKPIGAGVATVRASYAPHRCMEQALDFLAKPRQKPFFLFFSTNLPHANNEAGKNGMEIPDDSPHLAPYAAMNWPPMEKNKAAMISLLDAQVGAMVETLRKANQLDNTIILFTSDNGPHREGGVDPAFHRSSGPLRGIKRDLYEGGIRVPLIVHWPAAIKPGAVSDVPFAMWDFPPTLAAAAGAAVPAGIDGLDHLPLLRGQPQPKIHEYLYWEFHEGAATKQAIRMGRWKGVRLSPALPLELYDLQADPGETRNLAAQEPQIIETITAHLKNARTENPRYPLREKPKAPRQPKPPADDAASPQQKPAAQ